MNLHYEDQRWQVWIDKARTRTTFWKEEEKYNTRIVRMVCPPMAYLVAKVLRNDAFVPMGLMPQRRRRPSSWAVPFVVPMGLTRMPSSPANLEEKIYWYINLPNLLGGNSFCLGDCQTKDATGLDMITMYWNSWFVVGSFRNWRLDDNENVVDFVAEHNTDPQHNTDPHYTLLNLKYTLRLLT